MTTSSTYSVILSKTDAERLAGSFRKRAVYQYIAEVLVRGLELLGVPAKINLHNLGDMTHPDCFASTGQYEISTRDGKKLVGSAQMTTRTAVLQQGSIPLTFSAGRVGRYLPEGSSSESTVAAPASCVTAEAGRPLSFTEAQAAFSRAFREGFGAADSELSPAEWERCQAVLTDRYSKDSWNLMY